MIHSTCSDCGCELTLDNVYLAKSRRCKVCQNRVENDRRMRDARRQDHRGFQKYANNIDGSEYGVYVTTGKTPVLGHF